MSNIKYFPLHEDHYERLLALANGVHGDNYMDLPSLKSYHQAGLVNGINASWVALDGERLVGFRLTWAAGNWQPDKWCSPELWGHSQDQVCYFKCNTVDSTYRAAGIGSQMLKLSIQEAAKQGAKAGLAHIWMQSPGNSAFKYFSKCGGKLVKEHPGKWQENCDNEGYVCPICGTQCDCVAAEMLLTFEDLN